MPSIDNLKKEAKRWLQALRQNDAQVRRRFENAFPNAPAQPVLRDVQHALAREHGHDNWKSLKQALQQEETLHYERLAEDFVNAYEGDAAALERFNRHYGPPARVPPAEKLPPTGRSANRRRPG